MDSMSLRMRPIAWFVTGVLLAGVIVVVSMTAWSVDAAPGDTDSTFVPITPCRLADTRPGDDRVGTAASLGSEESQTFVVHGANGQCDIPSDAVAVSLNVTALGASTQTFLTFWPEGTRPLAASLNPAPGQPPTPNAVAVGLSGAGAFSVYNEAGRTDVVIDVNGYYVRSSLTELADRLAAVEAGLASNTTAIEGLQTDLGVTNSGLAELDATRPFTVWSDFTAESGPGFGCYVPTFPTPCSSFQDTTETMQQIELVAPAPGTVTVTAVATLVETFGWVQCQIMDSTDDPDLARGGVRLPDVGSADTRGDIADVMTLVRAFDVESGPVTYYHRCRNEEGGRSDFQAATMTATWTPAP